MLQLFLLLLDKFLSELGWWASLNRLHNRHALLEQSHLLLFHLIENGDSARRVDELLAIHAIKEALDGIALLQFVESHDGFFPHGVQVFELRLI